jgi:hypothetical protein
LRTANERRDVTFRKSLFALPTQVATLSATRSTLKRSLGERSSETLSNLRNLRPHWTVV